MNDIPRLGETKTKPKIGDIRLTIDGKRRKVFDGRCWQYLCVGDINCRVQSKFACRFHKHLFAGDTAIEIPTENKADEPKADDIQILANGNRRIWRGGRWYNLCRMENCSSRAREFCKAHQNERMSLPNTSKPLAERFRLTTRARSCTLTSEKPVEKPDHGESEEPTPPATAALEVPDSQTHRSEENIFEAVNASTLEKKELHTRNGRRVRCNRLIWKHLCAEKKNGFYRRKYQRHSVPAKKTDLIKDAQTDESSATAPLPSDTADSTVETSPITHITNSKKRKLRGDGNTREHIVPKRRTLRQTDLEKPIVLHIEPNSSSAASLDSPTKDQSLGEPIENEPEISFALKPNRLNTTYQSIEIPVQPPTPLTYDPSCASILEQFGTIIKKEAVVEEESLICVPTTHVNDDESPCETLQDFLRAEEMKKKEFKLDCQRISYRLAKIQDCIGSISSLAS